MGSRRTLALSAQVLVLHIIIVVITLVVVAGAGYFHLRDTLTEQYGQRALAVARTVSLLPETSEAIAAGVYGGELQGLVETIRLDTGMTYIAVADLDGVRLTHPTVDLIGERLSTDPSAALNGETTISTETGTLGATVRAKVPILSADGDVLGLVSVGISTTTIGAMTRQTVFTAGGYGAIALGLGVVGSYILARRVRRKTLGLAPSEISLLYENREAMLLSIREGVVTLDRRGRISLMNDEAKRLLAITGTATGTPLRDLVPSAHFGAIVDGSYDGSDTTVVSQDRVLVVSRRAVNVRGDEIGSVVSLRDLTELQALVSELASVKGMADSLRAKAHEYANRMHTIAGLLELGRVAEAVSYITHESRFAQALTEAYADELGDPTLVALLLSKSAVASERGIDLRVDRDTALITSRLKDPHDAVTVVGNLIDNAFDAAALASLAHSWVRVSLQAEGSTLVVTVSDSGEGVAADTVELVFEYGFSTKPESPDGSGATGRGIGLALVSETVKLHGGTVTLVDRVGADGAAARATFRATLPEMLVDVGQPAEAAAR